MAVPKTKALTKTKKTTEPVLINDIKLRIINLHDYDLREINNVTFTMKDGTKFNVAFNPNPVDKALSYDDMIYIKFMEAKPYYNKYQLLFQSTKYTTRDFDLATFTSEFKTYNPNYQYEF